MGQQMNMMMQRLGQDSLTPEQVAWRKLQEEYYEEKRRKEEQIGLHGGRPLQDMMGMGGMMVRGPPPPYHSKPGDQWPPGMGAQLRGPMDVQDPMQLRGGPPFPGPRFPGNQMQRVPGFGGMQGMPMEVPMNAMQRPVRPGMGWTEDLPPMGGPGNFAQNAVPYPGGQGEAERFMTPRVREELLRHQLLEKRSMGMQRPLSMAGSAMGQGMEMERMMQAHRQMDPAIFPGQMAGGEGLAGTPMGMEFGGGRGLLSPPMGQSGLREVDPPMGPGNLNMNMNVNMNMNMNLNVQMTPQQQMLMSQKMRGPGDMMGPQGLSPEEMARVRAQNSSSMMGGPQKMLMPSQFPNQGQQGFSGGQGPYQAMPQDMGNTQDMFSPDQSSMPMGSVGTTRLSHMPLPPASNPPGSVHSAPTRGLGRRPSDLTISINQMGSPGMGHLKSPTLSQVHSPLVTSPSANLKSPQTPSQMVPLPSANPPGPLKSPQVLSSSLSVRSPTGSPSRLKSPSMAVPSPGWVASPKTAMPSPGVPQNKQPPLNMNSSTTLGNMEQGKLSGPGWWGNWALTWGTSPGCGGERLGCSCWGRRAHGGICTWAQQWLALLEGHVSAAERELPWGVPRGSPRHLEGFTLGLSPLPGHRPSLPEAAETARSWVGYNDNGLNREHCKEMFLEESGDLGAGLFLAHDVSSQIRLPPPQSPPLFLSPRFCRCSPA